MFGPLSPVLSRFRTSLPLLPGFEAVRLPGVWMALFPFFMAWLAAVGAELVDPIQVVAPKAVRSAERLVFLTEFKAGLNRYLSTRGPDTAVRSLADVIGFNRDHSAQVMPYFPQDLFEQAETAAGLDDPAYLAARDTCLRRTRAEGIDRVLAERPIESIFVFSSAMAQYVLGEDARSFLGRPHHPRRDEHADR